MDLDAFKGSLAAQAPPPGLALAVQALWWEAKGDWDKAHECAQAQDDLVGARVHAYLHRREGDMTNARYWYRRNGETPPSVPLEAEWEQLARALLAGA